MRFAVISEGITDQITIDYITSEVVKRTFGAEATVNYLQPPLDETDQKQGDFGGWEKALAACANNLVGALSVNDFVIVHLDTDIADQLGIALNDGGSDRAYLDVVHDMEGRIAAVCGEFWEEVRNRIIFAVSHRSVECWLLVLLFPSFRGEKTKNCEGKLHMLLAKEGERFRKDARFFHNMCRRIKIKDPGALARRDCSLGRFVSQLISLQAA